MLTTQRLKSEILALINKKGLNGKAAEVGVKFGDFSVFALERWVGEKYYMVDAWRFFPGIKDMAQVPDAMHTDFMRTARTRTLPYAKRTAIICETSIEASALFQDNSLDWVYIDAAHNYDNVLADLIAWTPKVKPGGIIWGDDYIDGVAYDTEFAVRSAVNDFFAKKKVNGETAVEGLPFMPQWWVEL